MLTDLEIEYLVQTTWHNRRILERAVEEGFSDFGCFTCQRKSAVSEIQNYENEVTAVCPHCNSTTVLPGVPLRVGDNLSMAPLSNHVLRELHRWRFPEPL